MERRENHSLGARRWARSGVWIVCGSLRNPKALSDAGEAIGGGLSATGSKATELASATGRGVAGGASRATAKAYIIGTTGKQGLARAYAWTKSRAAAISPQVYMRVAKLGRRVQSFARARTAAPSLSLAARDLPSEHAVRPNAGELQVASVHVIEVYAPHKDGAELYGKPANEPWTPVAAPVHERLEDHDTTLSEAEATTALQGAPAEAKNALSSLIQSGGAVGGMALAAGLADTMRAGSGRGGLWLRRQKARALAFVGALPFLKSEAWGKAFAWANTETLARAKARAQAASENWATTKGLSLSQMMIIAGAVFLVCGGLLIGGGLLMRASSGPAVAAADPVETFSGITWLFEDPDLPLPERAVFTLSGTPRAFLINGLSIRGVNNSDEPLTGLEGVLKPDIQRPELKLSLKLDEDTHANHPSADGAESVAVAAVPKNTVPPHASFRLIFPFPAEAKGDQDGISTDELFESYGGLLLKLRYETEGTEKSVIQYLAPDMLKAQLDEVPGQAGDS